jgi:hypothetical protein
MPQHVSIRNCSQITPPLRSSTFWPRRRPTASHGRLRLRPPRHLTAHIARRHRVAFGSYRTHFIARHRPTKTLPPALSQARKSPHREGIPTAPVELCMPARLTQNSNAIIARTTAASNTRFQRAHIAALCSRIVPSTDQVVLLKISLYLRYGNIFFGVARFHNNTKDHNDISLVNSNRQPHLLLAVPTTHNIDVLCAFRLPPTADFNFTTVQHSQR